MASFDRPNNLYGRLDEAARGLPTGVSIRLDEARVRAEEVDPLPGWAEDYASYEEFEEWARCEKEATKRNAPGWGWPTPDGSSPLEDLFTGPANLRVLRLLWTEDKFCWPTQIARRTHLSRSSVHAALGRLMEWGMVERIPAWDSNRTFAYRLHDPHPLVREMGRLFLVEAGLRGGWAR